MLKEPHVPLFDLITALSDAMDLVSPAVVNHHKQVAYIALCLGEELGLPLEQRNQLVLAGALHDIGALSLNDREGDRSPLHAELAYSLLKEFPPLARAATLARFHHVTWRGGEGSEFNMALVPQGSHVLHLADYVAVHINRQQEVLGQVKSIREKVAEGAGIRFVPQLVEVFRSLAAREYFWLDLIAPSLSAVLRRRVNLETIELDSEGLLSLANLFRRAIDFRSQFTTTHSSGVAASAEALARLAGFSARECRLMKVAGYLHDLGKLAVPKEILEKPGKLTEAEFNVIRAHSFYTYRTLEAIADFDLLNAWASFHHEYLDGSGYPFHLRGEALPLGSRIMVVADIFTALTEPRPYREGMPGAAALQILQRLAEAGKVDASLLDLLTRQFEEINTGRVAAQTAAVEEYRQFQQVLGAYLE